MATWGVGIFDSELALDWVDEIIETDDAEDVPAKFESIFIYALDTNYVEHEDCCAVTVSCGVIDMLLNNTKYPTQEQDIQEWVEDHKDLKIPSKLAHLGADALEIITSKKSELNELWQKNEAEYATWRLKIDKLTQRLRAIK